MKSRKISQTQAAALWHKFGEAIGFDMLRTNYGGNWPRSPVAGESVFTFGNDQGERVGWASLRLDPVEPIVWLVMGIWPEFQKQNHAHEITRWAMKKVFSGTEANYIIIAISRDNREYLR